MKTVRLALLASAILTPLAAHAADADSCKAFKLADFGWTDIAFTNASVVTIAEALGYQPTQELIGLTVTYEMLKSGDIDVFLGNWRPAQDIEYKAYFDDGTAIALTTNLEGAKYTLAVPKYVADAGVTTFADLAKHADKFGKKIYGIEPGTNGPLVEMIAAGRHGLGDWELVESSEAAMLTQVAKAVSNKDWIVFLGWQPHPMNTTMEMDYLAGGDVEFGPNFGGATVHTVVGKGFPERCPNLTKLLTNVTFDIDYENKGMGLIMQDGKSAPDAAKEMMKAEPERVAKWLDGVTTFDGQPGLPAVQAALK